MNGGVKATLLISCFGLGGCATAPKQVKIQAIPDPASVLSRGGDEVATARGQLLIGNVGLALEGFRKAQRDNPTDAAPLAGIGDCYSAMGRLDLAQSSYEGALALAPHDRRLLLALAEIFDREGLPLRAAGARADADLVLQPPPVVKAPASPVSTATAVAAVPPQAAQALAVKAPASAVSAKTTTAAVPQLAGGTGLEQISASRGTITVELPPARPVEHLASSSPPPLPPIEDLSPPSSSVTVALPPARPAPIPVAPPPVERRNAMADMLAPRLERLTRSEVALITTSKPIWRAQEKVATASVGGVRWVALTSPSERPNVQVLNAAQSRGIAASARSVLLNRGWRRIAIGNAPAIQQKSVVLYPRNRAKLGRSLAAQFGVGARMVERDILVLVLGRDAVDRISGPQKS